MPCAIFIQYKISHTIDRNRSIPVASRPNFNKIKKYQNIDGFNYCSVLKFKPKQDSSIFSSFEVIMLVSILVFYIR